MEDEEGTKLSRALLQSCARGNLKEFQNTLDKIIPTIRREFVLSLRDNAKRTCLHLAAMEVDPDHVVICNCLINLYGDFPCNIQDSNGWTYLHCAAHSKNEELLLFLMDRDADVNITNSDKNIPLHFLARSQDGQLPKQQEILLKMKKKGVKVDAQNSNGETVLHQCVWKRNLSMARNLIELLNPNLNLGTRSQNETCLHWAARNGDEAMVQLLLSNGAVPIIKGLHGTAADVCHPKKEKLREMLKNKERKMLMERVLLEIVNTEENYCEDLSISLQVFYDPLRRMHLISEEDLSKIFVNLEEVFKTNRAFNESIKQSLSISNISSSFLTWTERFGEVYSVYCAGEVQAIAILQSLQGENPEFAAFLKKCSDDPNCRKRDLESFLIKPLQRICKYPLLLTEVLKVIPPGSSKREQDQLLQALEEIKRVVASINAKVPIQGHPIKESGLLSYSDFNSKSVPSFPKSTRNVNASIRIDLLSNNHNANTSAAHKEELKKKIENYSAKKQNQAQTPSTINRANGPNQVHRKKVLRRSIGSLRELSRHKKSPENETGHETQETSPPFPTHGPPQLPPKPLPPSKPPPMLSIVNQE